MFFKINDKLAIGAETYKTRYSWGHKAHLYRVHTPEHDDECIESTKITYYNRTWERYEFESILEVLVEKALKHHAITKAEADTCNAYIKNYDRVQDDTAGLRSVGLVMALGDLFTTTKKDANDWKARMLKAGLGNKGLIMPDDWDTLDEATKEARLNGAIAQLK
jgi:hypothetical protein